MASFVSCDGKPEAVVMGLALPHTAPVGLWMDPLVIATLEMKGPAWESLENAANQTLDLAVIDDGNSQSNVITLAKALAYCRTGRPQYRDDVVRACGQIIGREDNRSLDLGRELPAFIFAADLVQLPPDLDQRFRSWLDRVRHVSLKGGSLISTHESRPNNWGTHCGAARVAIAAYLGDLREIALCASILHGWLGGRGYYKGFDFGRDLSWQANPDEPVGINPKGAMVQGHSIDGVLPDDQRRGGSFRWPPTRENYVYEALQGALLQAVILDRFGYPVWKWENMALLRAYRWLHDEAKFPAEGDDTWQLHIINYFYDTDFPAPVPANSGKNLGWTDWTHSR